MLSEKIYLRLNPFGMNVSSLYAQNPSLLVGSLTFIVGSLTFSVKLILYVMITHTKRIPLLYKVLFQI